MQIQLASLQEFPVCLSISAAIGNINRISAAIGNIINNAISLNLPFVFHTSI